MEIPDFNIPEDQIESFHRYYNEKMLDECKKFEQERKEIFEKTNLNELFVFLLQLYVY